MKINLTPRRRKAIVALLSLATIQEAAAAAGVTERTVYRWLADSDFRAALVDAEGGVIDAAARRLIGEHDQALNTLSTLMGSAKSENVRRAAADSWLSQMFRIRELRNEETRLSELERIVNELQKQAAKTEK